MSKVYTVKDLDNPPPEFKDGMKVKWLFKKEGARYYGFTPGVPIDGALKVIKGSTGDYYNVSESRHGQWHDYVESFTLVGYKRKIGVFRQVPQGQKEELIYGQGVTHQHGSAIFLQTEWVASPTLQQRAKSLYDYYARRYAYRNQPEE